MSLTDPFSRERVESFLSLQGLSYSGMDCYLAAIDPDGEILAGAGLEKDVVKCVAVSPSHRDEGLTNQLISRLISIAYSSGFNNVKVFTKPSNRAIFESLGFALVGESRGAVLMENGSGVEKLKARLAAHRIQGRCGAIVLNANPLTWGHDFLVRTACTDVDKLFLVPVPGDSSMFTFKERLQALSSAFLDETRVEVVQCGDYCISPSTFPSYFIKDDSEAATAQMELDLDIFARHIAPALGASVRFVGSEPLDPMTARYNALMAERLPLSGIEVVEVPRTEENGAPISASAVRKYILEGNFPAADALAHPESMPMMLRALSRRALEEELRLAHKPGLVSPTGRGAHKDMDFSLMERSLDAISPFFHEFASINPDDDVAADMVETGLRAEKAMMAATLGVNTHRGAIFALGLTCTAFAQAYWEGETVDAAALRRNIVSLACRVPRAKDTHGGQVCAKYKVKGALQNAREGYPLLFKDWLPLYRREKDPMRVLLRIMSSLDDTNIIYRKGPGAAERVRLAASKAYTQKRGQEELESLCEREGISPGGSADMLALTIFIDSLLP